MRKNVTVWSLYIIVAMSIIKTRIQCSNVRYGLEFMQKSHTPLSTYPEFSNYLADFSNFYYYNFITTTYWSSRYEISTPTKIYKFLLSIQINITLNSWYGKLYNVPIILEIITSASLIFPMLHDILQCWITISTKFKTYFTYKTKQLATLRKAAFKRRYYATIII